MGASYQIAGRNEAGQKLRSPGRGLAEVKRDAGMMHEAERVLAGTVYNMYAFVTDEPVNLRLLWIPARSRDAL